MRCVTSEDGKSKCVFLAQLAFSRPFSKNDRSIFFGKDSFVYIFIDKKKLLIELDVPGFAHSLILSMCSPFPRGTGKLLIYSV